MDSLIENTKTPMEKWKEGLEQLTAWRDKWGFSDELFNKGKNQLADSLGLNKVQLANADEKGSQEARSAILAATLQQQTNVPQRN